MINNKTVHCGIEYNFARGNSPSRLPLSSIVISFRVEGKLIQPVVSLFKWIIQDRKLVFYFQMNADESFKMNS